MKHLIKLFALAIFFSGMSAVAQDTEIEYNEVETTTETKADKVYEAKSDADKRVYKKSKTYSATKMTAEDKMATMDTDKDGKISADEASNAENKRFSEHFAKIDTNADGFVDLTEMKAKMAKKKHKATKMKSKPEY